MLIHGRVELLQWKKFWLGFGRQINLINIVIPERPSGLCYLVVIPRGLTNNVAYALCADKFSCGHNLGTDDLDKIKNNRNPDLDYACWVGKEVVGVNLLEALVCELKYHSTISQGDHVCGGVMLGRRSLI